MKFTKNNSKQKKMADREWPIGLHSCARHMDGCGFKQQTCTNACQLKYVD